MQPFIKVSVVRHGFSYDFDLTLNGAIIPIQVRLTTSLRSLENREAAPGEIRRIMKINVGKRTSDSLTEEQYQALFAFVVPAVQQLYFDGEQGQLLVPLEYEFDISEENKSAMVGLFRSVGVVFPGEL